MHSGARQLPIQHLSVRLPWHDTGWAGTVCPAPSKKRETDRLFTSTEEDGNGLDSPELTKTALVIKVLLE